jgi:ferredoxin
VRDFTQPGGPRARILLKRGDLTLHDGWNLNCTFPGAMAYVITEACTKDNLCVEACPVDCIHPKKDDPRFEEPPTLHINPAECIDCGACVPVCPTNAIFALDDLPADKAAWVETNAAYFA